jgi:hypothetical protein
MLSEDTMQREAGSLLADLAISVGDLRRPVGCCRAVSGNPSRSHGRCSAGPNS